MRRRSFLSLAFVPVSALAGKVRYPEVAPGRPFAFPRDDGAHPAYRTEWWYVTGWLDDSRGFQVTFFRARPEEQSDNPSAFNPRQILLAHAALSDPRRGHLFHDQRAAREALGLAGAELGQAQVWIDDWRLAQDGDRFRARIPARDFDFELVFTAPGAPVLQGEGGFSRKGRRPHEASYYYSRPQLDLQGLVDGKPVSGKAWLDHEWSSAYLPPEAEGWDWTGINLFDGGSLMAFRMRGKNGDIHYAPPGVSFRTLRTWQSPRTGVRYPVSMEVNGLRLEPLMDDQELDARASTGTIYWEGAVRAFSGDKQVGRGYLELTGYWKPMRL
ncbi:MAG TPA: carotenoid 1,2-hydratase [Burkholderiales bacterium]|nr:carotenoid 1,2-hydratase [Burkholderiales bacterium]